MLKLKTNAESKIFKPTIPVPPGSNICMSTYDQYKNQRVSKDISTQNIEDLTNRFKTGIAAPLNTINPDLAMGEYFVIPVSEITELLSSTGDTPEFIHIYNAVRETTNSQGQLKTFPVVILVPVSKQTINGTEGYANCTKDNTVYVEAYPCPPAAGCPNSSSIHQNALSPANNLNNFNTLF